ncbi:MAG: acyl carrier protein [Lachnospiraceae bacterium]|jgi:acyl carrier protein|nr:acyl carrier protein [Lachnospiraceae bacterium]MCI1397487.1 acyl carrier protein [Lachnospiraceae bacterium]MCI1423265.1 acyl carrier protein [Lachnospiraceae bacterium]MCI1452060.1 acyl carrier protein [Lachnospiraceae bacterium]MDD5848342.1 acyl carrier protein [Bacillota bacterium]
MDSEFDRIKKIVADVLNVDPNEITEQTTFEEDLGADSLDMYQILLGLEEEFGVEVDLEKVKDIKTAGEALQVVRQAVGENA